MNGTTLQELMELGGWKSFEMRPQYREHGGFF